MAPRTRTPTPEYHQHPHHWSEEPTMSNIPFKLIFSAIGTVLFILSLFFIAGWNDAGNRTVVVNGWTGSVSVKLDPGIYWKWFGRGIEYPDYITFDFDQNDSQVDGRTVQQIGYGIQYQDGGTGTVYGQGRFELPVEPDMMIALHKAFKSAEGVAYKLIKPTAESSLRLTAGLMTSEESYTTKRAIFQEWARDQIQNGQYRTTLAKKKVSKEEAGVGTANDATKPTDAKAEDEMVEIEFPIIEKIGGVPAHLDNDLKPYGIELKAFQITSTAYEESTNKQIQTKRTATMGIITSRANAEKAKQETITAEQEGLKAVMEAKYKQEVEKEKATVDAMRDKEVAKIGAEKLVEVAKQKAAEQEQNKIAQGHYKQAETLRGEGDAAYKKAVIEADGALEQKLAAYVAVQSAYAREFGKQPLVPQIMMGGAGDGTGAATAANSFIDLMAIKAAKDLNLDLSVPNKQIK
jgi:hypothetical protein